MKSEGPLLDALNKAYNKQQELFMETCRLRDEVSRVMAELSVAIKEYRENHPPVNGRAERDEGDDELDIF